MGSRATNWIPGITLGLGWLAISSIQNQQELPLRSELGSVLPRQVGEYTSTDLTISPEEQRVAGMTTYLMRVFKRDSLDFFSLYVGYYATQSQGTSIHSPKNCLPGAGWEPIASGSQELQAGGQTARVNRYVLQKGASKVLVYYWYQGRGRISSSEFRVKLQLLKDRALFRRSDEALVRLVVPLRLGEATADSLALAVSSAIIPRLAQALPPPPGS